jgi:hypothetical protein
VYSVRAALAKMCLGAQLHGEELAELGRGSQGRVVQVDLGGVRIARKV